MAGSSLNLGFSFDLDLNPRGEYEEAFEASENAASDYEATKYEDGVKGDLTLGCEALERIETATIVEVRKEALASTLTWSSRRNRPAQLV
jgi:hypothetical protein